MTWIRPARPAWMLDWMWDIVPETMTLRLVRVRIIQNGCRVGGFFVVTNLMDCEKYTSESICELYLGRWQIEVDLRTIKTFMQMDILRGYTPEMVEKEFAVGLLAYNIVRAKMLETAVAIREEAAQQESQTSKKPVASSSSATTSSTASSSSKAKRKTNKIDAKDVMPRNISFSYALASIVASYVTVHFMSEEMQEVNRKLAEQNRRTVQVGNRPDRHEPRCVKRRPKSYSRMQSPREELNEQLRSGTSPTQSGDEAARQLGE